MADSWRRFALKVAGWLAPAFGLWWISRDAAEELAVSICKLLHALASHPAPHLICELHSETWHATMAAPFLALVMASGWVPLRQRLIRCAVGYAVLLLLTALSMVFLYSPYLPSSPAMVYFDLPLAKSQMTVWPIAIWLLIVDWPAPGSQVEQSSRSGEGSRRGRAVAGTLARYSWLFRSFVPVLALVLAVVTIVSVSPSTRASGSAIRRVVGSSAPAEAITEEWEQLRQNPSGKLSYLLGRLLENDGREEDARRFLYWALEKWGLEAQYHQEFGPDVPDGVHPLRPPGAQLPPPASAGSPAAP